MEHETYRAPHVASKLRISLCALGVVLVGVACDCATPKPAHHGVVSEPDVPQGPRPDRSTLFASIDDMAKVAEASAAALSSLPAEQQRAVLELVAASQALAVVGEEGSSAQFKLASGRLDSLPTKLPHAGTPTASIVRACRAESIAYVSAMASCHRKGKEEDDCPGAWGAAAAEIACQTRVLEKLRRTLVGPRGPVGGGAGRPPI